MDAGRDNDYRPQRYLTFRGFVGILSTCLIVIIAAGYTYVTDLRTEFRADLDRMAQHGHNTHANYMELNLMRTRVDLLHEKVNRLNAIIVSMGQQNVDAPY